MVVIDNEMMKLKYPVLSIAIPTHNGASYIREALESIIIQLNEIEEEIEVVVSDNASSDQTPDIMKEYQNKYRFIRYFRNEENLGGDKNLTLAVKRSTGKYVWIIGDDDKIAIGGIRTVLNVLDDNQKLAVIFMNTKTFNKSFDECLQEKLINIDKDILFQSADSFLQKIGANAALTPSSIVCRDLWLRIEKKRYEGTGWLQLITIYLLLPDHPSYCIATPYSLFREGSERWHKNGAFLKQLLTLLDIFKSLPEYGYSEATVKQIVRPFIRGMPLTILGEKKCGLNVNLSLIKELVSRFRSSPSFWLFGLPALLLPSIIHRTLWKICAAPSVKPVVMRIRRKLVG